MWFEDLLQENFCDNFFLDVVYLMLVFNLWIPWSSYILTYNAIWASPVVSGKKSACNEEPQGTWVRSLGWEGPLNKAMPTHSSILAWRIPWTEGPGGLQSKGLQSHRWLTQLSRQADKSTLLVLTWWSFKFKHILKYLHCYSPLKFYAFDVIFYIFMYFH